MTLARDDSGLCESDHKGSSEKWSKSGYIFKVEPMRFPCGLNVKWK